MNLNKQPGLIDAPVAPEQSFNEQQWQQQVTESLRVGLGQAGDQSQKFVTWSDMEDAGMIENAGSSSGGNSGGGFSPVPITQPPDLTPPPPLEKVAASGGMTAIYITWDNPLLNYNYYVEVHKASEDDVGKAVLIGTTNGQIYEHVVGSDTNLYYFWVRVIKQTGGVLVIGPWQGTSGVSTAAASDPQWILEQVSGRFDTDDLATQVFNVDLFGVKSPDPAVETFAFVVDTTTDPPYVAMNGAYIQDATITDAKIGSLNVDKLIGGTAQFVEANILDATITNAKIGNVIQSDNYVANNSGWTLNKDGFFEAQNAYIRGKIEASHVKGTFIEGSEIDGGVITGSTIIGSKIYASETIILSDPWGNGTIVYYDRYPDVPLSCRDSFSESISPTLIYHQQKNTFVSTPVSAGYHHGFVTDIRYRWTEIAGGRSSMEWTIHSWNGNDRWVNARILFLDPGTGAILQEGRWVGSHIYGSSATRYDTVAGVEWKFVTGGLIYIYSKNDSYMFGSPDNDSLNGRFALEVHAIDGDVGVKYQCSYDNLVHP